MKRLTLALAAVAALGLTSTTFADTSPNRAPFLSARQLPKAGTSYALTGQAAQQAVEYRWESKAYTTPHGQVILRSHRVIVD